MTIINGHYNGKRVVFDEAVPPGIAPDTPVRLLFGDGQARDMLAELAKLACPGGLPRGFSQRHESHVNAGPRPGQTNR